MGSTPEGRTWRGQADEDQRGVALVVVLGLLFATFVVAGWFNRGFLIPDPATWEPGHTVSSAYDPPDKPVELYFNQGDGQLFAHQAMDPFLQHPEGIRGGANEEAYRLQRPLYGWVGWIASAGRPGLVGWGLIGATILSVGLLVGIGATVARRFGQSPWWGIALLAAPGVAVDLIRCGPEVLGTALVGIGLLAWLAPGGVRRTGVAIAALAAACLARETLLVVPLTLVAVDWWTSRPAGGPLLAGAVRRLRSPLLLSVVPYLAWVAVVRAVVGAWPKGSVSGRLSPVPFAALAGSFSRFDREEVIALALIAIAALYALLRATDLRIRALAATHLLLAGILGKPVWASWLDFSRVLLPVTMIGLFAVLGRLDAADEPVVEPLAASVAVGAPAA